MKGSIKKMSKIPLDFQEFALRHVLPTFPSDVPALTVQAAFRAVFHVDNSTPVPDDPQFGFKTVWLEICKM